MSLECLEVERVTLDEQLHRARLRVLRLEVECVRYT